MVASTPPLRWPSFTTSEYILVSFTLAAIGTLPTLNSFQSWFLGSLIVCACFCMANEREGDLKFSSMNRTGVIESWLVNLRKVSNCTYSEKSFVIGNSLGEDNIWVPGWSGRRKVPLSIAFWNSGFKRISSLPDKNSCRRKESCSVHCAWAIVGRMNTIKRNIGRIFTSLIFIILITFLSPRLIPPLNPPFESRYFKIYWDAYTLFES